MQTRFALGYCLSGFQPLNLNAQFEFLSPSWPSRENRFAQRLPAPGLLGAVRNLDNAPDVRHAAAVALGQIAAPSSLGELETLATDYPEVSTRRALAGVLTQVKERAARTESNFNKPNPVP